MKTILHHEFTLWIYDCERNEEKVPAMIFEDGSSFDEIALMLIKLDKLGIKCSLTCDTWSNSQVNDSNEELNFD